jgi:hypothetical protein
MNLMTRKEAMYALLAEQESSGMRFSFSVVEMQVAFCKIEVTCLHYSSIFQLGFGVVWTVLCFEIPHERQAQRRYRQG